MVGMERRLFDDALEDATKKLDELEVRELPIPIHQQPSYKESVQEELSGKKKIKYFYHLLDNLPSGEKASFLQMICIDEYIKSMLALIYGEEEFNRFRSMILGMYGLTIYTSLVLLIMGRRVGKSSSWIFFCACAILAFPGFSCDLFAQSLSLSQTTLYKIAQLLKAWEGNLFVIEYDNRNQFMIRVGTRKESQHITALSQTFAQVRPPFFLVDEREKGGSFFLEGLRPSLQFCVFVAIEHDSR